MGDVADNSLQKQGVPVTEIRKKTERFQPVKIMSLIVSELYRMYFEKYLVS